MRTRVQAARDRTHEEEILRGLQHLRVALSQFQAHTGVYPDALADLVLPAGGHPSGTFPRTYQGPYLPAGEGIAGSGIPINPYVGPGDHNIGHHWRYNSDTGAVLPAVAPAKFIEALERNPGDPEL